MRGVFVSRASFALPMPRIQVCRRVEYLAGAPKFQILDPKRARGQSPLLNVWEYPRIHHIPQKWEAMKENMDMDTVATSFISLYPPHSSDLNVRPSPKPEVPRGCRGTSLPRDWGVPQLLHIPQEWGQGVEIENGGSVGGFRLYPPYNSREVQEASCRGLGCPPVTPYPPKSGGQGVEIES